MKKTLYIIIFFSSLYNLYPQSTSEDYVLLDTFFSSLVTKDNINVYEKSSFFIGQEKFFSKAFLNEYTHPTIGVDSKKVRKLVKTLNFNYLAQQKSQVTNWDFSKSKYSIVKYIENPANQFDKIRRYKISKPIYSKKFKMAFIYYEDFCGFIDCGSTNVIIFKKCKGKWKLYLNIPISIS